MRPVRLEMAGFGSFKDTTKIEFEGAEFFALVGPTGSGKSTIIDALCFALYGSVPRLENRNLVAPVISQGKLEAKVRFDFSVDGSLFTAVRVVRRSGKGATTKEARLERDGEALASGPDELTDAVGDLLGLGFDHFTKCVVLPQGEFARFLHDKPGDRQGLVVKLLNLGIYEQMGQAARQAAGEKKIEVQGCEQQLEDYLSWATASRLEELKASSKKLGALRKTAADKLPRIEKLAETERDADRRAGEAHEWVAKLGKLEVPGGIEDLADLVTAAKKNAEACDKAVTAARKETQAAEKTVRELGDRRALERALSAHEQRAKVLQELDPAEILLKKLESQLESARKVVAEREAVERTARDAQDRAKIEHQAQHLASVLEKDEPCPVCLQKVERLPKHPDALGLKDADQAVEAAVKALATARAAADKAAREVASVEGNVAALRGQIEGLERDIAQHPDAKSLERLIEKIDAAEASVEEARNHEGRARDEADVAHKALRLSEEQQSKAREVFDDARFAVAELDPPAPGRKSVAQDWQSLVEWAKKRSAKLATEEAKAATAADKARADRVEIVDELLASCTECEVDVADETEVLEAVVAAHTNAESETKRVEDAIRKSEDLHKKIAALRIEQATAHELSLHLSAKPGRFPGWIVNAALERLVDGATEILDQLSQGGYALATDDHGNFLVIDRHNANEKRSARTLSGGETFLASLSLALALADQLADLAAEGSARLDAIFLDEGFGTLDPETLDTVAATVENLAADGRMVGIVTHVRELAERVPLQFRVRKDTGTSSIERVIA